MAQIVYGAEDFFRLSKAFAQLPATIKGRVVRRAMGRVASMGATQVVKRAAERIDVPQLHVRKRTTSYQLAGEAVVNVRSGWIPLYALGARETRTGVTVRARGSYRSAFIATTGKGRSGVFKREGADRYPIRELYGPNPAHDIVNNADVYQRLVIDIAARQVMPRMLHELGRALPR